MQSERGKGPHGSKLDIYKRELKYEREWELMQGALWWSMAHNLYFPLFILFSSSLFFFCPLPIITIPFISFH